MDLDAINDQLLPQNATDGFAGNFDFWPHHGTAEWVQYNFEKPVTVSETAVLWFDDSGRGGACAVPSSWRVLYRAADGGWRPVEALAPYARDKGKLVRVPFVPVTTHALRLELQLEPGKPDPGRAVEPGKPLPGARSAGLYEWVVK
jgi:hypothetical protein